MPRSAARCVVSAIRRLVAVGLVIFVSSAAGPVSADESGKTPITDVAAKILDDALPGPERSALIEANGDRAADLIAAMAAGLGSDPAEEYRRIPRIWAVAIAAGKENRPETLRGILNASLPQPGGRLADWQAVVIGGGVINGIGLIGGWPQERIESVIGENAALQSRWQQSLTAAVAMADNPDVKTGTRYDALRMVAMRGWNASREQLLRYLGKGVNGELQMGAVSGLADIPDPAATETLLTHLSGLAPGNRNLALDGLLRSEERMLALLAAVERGDVKIEQLGPDRVKRLREASAPQVRERASVVLSPL